MNLNFTPKWSRLTMLLLLLFSFSFNVVAQGDLCTDPITVSEGTTTVDTLVGGGAVTPSATNAKWYSYTPAANALVTVSSCGGGADTRLWVWTGGCDLATNTLVANNDDICEFAPGSNLWASEVSFIGNAGTEYLINWDDRWEPNGFDFSITTEALPTVNITVVVDMSNVMTAAEGAFIAGEFNGWTGEAMTDDGDDIYSFVISGVAAGDTVEYKFQNGPGAWEDNFSADECGFNNNRFVVAPLEDLTVRVVPFNSCYYDGELCTIPIVVSEGTHTVDTLIGNGAVVTGATAAAWYSYTPTEDGFVNVNSCLGGADTRVTVWTGGCDLATNTEVISNDDFCEFDPGSFAWASQVEFEVTAGTEYLINWDNRWEENGFDFSISLISTPPDPTCDDPSFIITDDIESYDLGDINGAAGHWGVWTGASSSGIVSEDFAASGTKSVMIDGNVAGLDALLTLNNASSGHYWVGWKMYVPEENNAYFNLQHDATPGAAFGFECDMVDGTGTLLLNNQDDISFSYPEGEWFDVILIFDIENDEARMVVGDITVTATTAAAWGYTDDSTDPSLSAINLYPIDASYIYYVDDIAFALLPDAGVGEYCYTATAIEPGTHTVGELACFGAAQFINDSGFAGQWFSYTPTEDGFISISSCGGGVDSRGWIFEGDCRSLRTLGVNDDMCDLGNGSLWASYREAPVTAGNTYYILWDDMWETTGFDFELAFTGGALPEGDFCQSAITAMVNTDMLVEEFGDAAVAGPNIGNFGSSTTPYTQSIWYTWTPTEADTVDITSCASGTDTRVWVYTGTCGAVDDLTLIASSDDDCGDASLIEDWVPEVGTTYYIEWDNENNADPFTWRIEKEIIIDVDEIELTSGINVFPNPARDQLSVQFDLSEAVDMEVRLVNTLGQVVDSKVLDAVQGETVDFNVSNLAVGTYFVQFITANASSSQKVVITD